MDHHEIHSNVPASFQTYLFPLYFTPLKVFPRRRAKRYRPSPDVGEEGKQDSTPVFFFFLIPFHLLRDTFRHFASVQLFVRVAGRRRRGRLHLRLEVPIGSVALIIDLLAPLDVLKLNSERSKIRMCVCILQPCTVGSQRCLIA